MDSNNMQYHIDNTTINTNITNINDESPVSTSDYLNNVFTGLFTMTPLDPARIPRNYTPSVLFMFIMIVIDMIINSFGTNEEIDMVGLIIVYIVVSPVVFLFTAISYYIVSRISSFILGKKYSPEEFARWVSIIPYFSFCMLLKLFVASPGFKLIIKLVFSFITFYYLYINYKQHYIATNRENQTLHMIFIALVSSSYLFIADKKLKIYKGKNQGCAG